MFKKCILNYIFAETVPPTARITENGAVEVYVKLFRVAVDHFTWASTYDQIVADSARLDQFFRKSICCS